MFIAVNNVAASLCLTSPTIILSGLILNVFLTSISIVTSPVPSKLGGLVNNLMTCSIGNCNSGVSSTVITLSVAGVKDAKTFKVDVLPEPVPPAINIFPGFAPPTPSTASHKKAATSLFIVPNFIRSRTVKGSFLNFLMVTEQPSMEIGGIVALTLEPSLNVASNKGD